MQLLRAMDPRAGLHGVWLMAVAPLVQLLSSHDVMYIKSSSEALDHSFDVSLTIAVPVQKLVHNFYGSGAAAPSIK